MENDLGCEPDVELTTRKKKNNYTHAVFSLSHTVVVNWRSFHVFSRLHSPTYVLQLVAALHVKILGCCCCCSAPEEKTSSRLVQQSIARRLGCSLQTCISEIQSSATLSLYISSHTRELDKPGGPVSLAPPFLYASATRSARIFIVHIPRRSARPCKIN